MHHGNIFRDCSGIKGRYTMMWPLDNVKHMLLVCWHVRKQQNLLVRHGEVEIVRICKYGDVGSGCWSLLSLYLPTCQEFDTCQSTRVIQKCNMTRSPGHLTHPCLLKCQLRDLSHVSFPLSSSSPSQCLMRTCHPVLQSMLLGWQRGKPCAFAILYAIFLTKLLWLSCPRDPFVHHGQHFGRMVHAMCNVNSLICNSIGNKGEEPFPEESLTDESVLFFLFSISSELMYASQMQG